MTHDSMILQISIRYVDVSNFPFIHLFSFPFSIFLYLLFSFLLYFNVIITNKKN